MKWFLAATVALALSATSYAAVKSGSGHYLLIYPSSTIETDLSGHCMRVENTSDAVVYLAASTPDVFTDALSVSKKYLKVSECAAR